MATRYVTLTEAGEQFFRPEPDSEAGYLLYQYEDGRWSWLFTEEGEEDETGPSFPDRASALLHIAQDWDSNGGAAAPQFLSILRGLATKAIMAGSDGKGN